MANGRALCWAPEGVKFVVGMDHGKGAGTTEPAPVGPAGDAGPIKPGGTKTPFRPYTDFIEFRPRKEKLVVFRRCIADRLSIAARAPSVRSESNSGVSKRPLRDHQRGLERPLAVHQRGHGL